MRRYNLDEVTQLLDLILAEKGGSYCYQSAVQGSGCVYFMYRDPQTMKQWGAPDCMIGRVLDKIGIHEISEPQSRSLYSLMAATGRDTVAPGDPEGRAWWLERFTEDACWLMGYAQREQDDHRPWGECVASAQLQVIADKLKGLY